MSQIKKEHNDLSSPHRGTGGSLTGGQGAKQIPNLFTLLNLIFGCIAIVFILQTGEAIVQVDGSGTSQVFFPGKTFLGCSLYLCRCCCRFFGWFFSQAI